MRVYKYAAMAAVSSLVFVSASSQAASCWYPKEASAIQLRDFQTMLVVGAMECQRQFPAALENYNKFVIAQRPLLVANNTVLKSHFAREDGARGTEAYDQHHTAAANSFSVGMARFDYAQCQRVARLAGTAARLSSEDLVNFAAQLMPPPYSLGCGAPETSAPPASARTALAVAEPLAPPAPVVEAPAVPPEAFSPASPEAVEPAVAAGPADAAPAPQAPALLAEAPAAPEPPAAVGEAPPAPEAPVALAEAAPAADVPPPAPAAEMAQQASAQPVPVDPPAKLAQADGATAKPPIKLAKAEMAPVRPVKPKTGPTRDEALKAAIAALQAATAVLQAVTAPEDGALPGPIASADLPTQVIEPAPIVPPEPVGN